MFKTQLIQIKCYKHCCDMEYVCIMINLISYNTNQGTYLFLMLHPEMNILIYYD